MYWQEDTDDEAPRVADDVVDLVFALSCKSLPVDHVYPLFEAVHAVLPWLLDEPSAGVHAVNVAASGNGWIRPAGPDELLYLSRRTRFELRVPRHRIADARQLEGKTLDVNGHSFGLQGATERPLSSMTTLFARHLATDQNLVHEEDVLQWASAQLKSQGINPRKMLCGTSHTIETPDKQIGTRSLMIAELEVAESLQLQQQGLGPYRHLGCGLFIPHREFNDLRKKKE